MKILVTGGAGFIGSHLVDKLIEKKHQVAVIDDLSTGKKENINRGARFYESNIRHQPELNLIFKKERPDIVYHLAAQISVSRSIKDPTADAAVNIWGSLNLFDLSVAYRLKKIIFISTGGAIYGDGVKLPTAENALAAPISPYGIAKLSVEKYLYYYNHQHRLPYSVLRLANIYGPRQDSSGEAGVVAIFCRQLKNGQPLFINGGRQTRDFVYVADVIDACLRSVPRKIKGIFNLGTGRQTTIQALANKLMVVSGLKVPIRRRPYLKGEQRASCLSYQKIKKEMSWHPKYDLNKGLAETWNWFKNN